jgi:uncharacterized protein (TIGR02147 family)
MNDLQIEILSKSIQRKQADNPLHSIRWLAKATGVSPSLMSLIINGKRNLPLGMADKICTILDIDRVDRDRLLGSLLQAKGVTNPAISWLKNQKTVSTQDSWQALKNKSMNLFGHWYHVAILDSTLLKDYDGTCEYIAMRLELEVGLVEEVFALMKDAGYLTLQNNVWKKSNAFLEIKSAKSLDSIRRIHSEQLEIAKKTMTEKTSEEDMQNRLITGLTITGSKERLLLIQQKIQQFLIETADEMSSGEAEDIYHLGIQIVPLTKSEPKGTA